MGRRHAERLLRTVLPAALAAACAHATPAPPPVEEPVVLLAPHWDQVCEDEPRPAFLPRLADIVRDEAGAVRAALALPPRAAGAPAPFVDVAVNYSRSGEVRTVHLLRHNVGDDRAGAVAEAVIGEVRDVATLLEPLYVRIRAIRDPVPRLAVIPALSCLPHVTHADDEPPRFLGDARVAGGLLGARAGEAWVQVRVHLSRRGEIDRIEAVRGDANLLARVWHSLSGVGFDPALLNGEPIEGFLTLSFGFSSVR